MNLSANARDFRFGTARGRVMMAAALMVVAGLAAYWNSLSGPFVLDDVDSIVGNASLRRLSPLATVLSPPSDAGVGGRPLANLSFALNYAWSGLEVRGYHLANLAIHLAAGLALFGIVRRTLLATFTPLSIPEAATAPLALAASVLWLLHPLQTEAVTYLSQRTESMMGLWYFLALYCFIRGVAPDGERGWFPLAVTACAAGMLTKEVMVTAPVIILLYDRTFVAGSFRAAWRTRKWLHLGFMACWVLVAFLLAEVHRRGVGYDVVSWWQYALTESRGMLHYLRLIFWPDPLIFDYGAGVVRSPIDAALPATGVGALVVATTVAVWRRPILGFVGAWFFVILAPTSSVVPVAGQPIAEHRMYLPLAAIVVAAVVALYRWSGRWTWLACTGAVMAFGFITAHRNSDYGSAMALWRDTLAKCPTSSRAHAGLGTILLQTGNIQAAITQLEESLSLDPNSSEAHNNLATALLEAGRTNEAVMHFEQSLRLRPGTASTHYNYGNVLLQLGRSADAIAQEQQALQLQPDFPEAHCALADAFFASRRLDDAVEHYSRALQRRSDLTPAHFGLANSLAQLGRIPEAIVQYEATLQAIPISVEAHFYLANAFFVSGRTADALHHYEATVQLKPDFAEGHYHLANALAQSGRTTEAIAHYEAALQLQPNFPAARVAIESLKSGNPAKGKP